MIATAANYLSGFTFKFWLSALAGVALLGVAGTGIGYWKGWSGGKQSVLDELALQAARAKAKAAEARERATEESNERAEQFEQQQEQIEKAIEDAQASGGNALDGLFGGLQDN